MKKYICLWLMLQLGCICIQAQEVLDTMYLLCQYKTQTIKLTAQKKTKDLIRLEIGKTVSKSYSYDTYQYDAWKQTPGYKDELVKAFTEARKKGGKDWLQRVSLPTPR